MDGIETQITVPYSKNILGRLGWRNLRYAHGIQVGGHIAECRCAKTRQVISSKRSMAPPCQQPADKLLQTNKYAKFVKLRKPSAGIDEMSLYDKSLKKQVSMLVSGGFLAHIVQSSQLPQTIKRPNFHCRQLHMAQDPVKPKAYSACQTTLHASRTRTAMSQRL